MDYQKEKYNKVSEVLNDLLFSIHTPLETKRTALKALWGHQHVRHNFHNHFSCYENFISDYLPMLIENCNVHTKNDLEYLIKLFDRYSTGLNNIPLFLEKDSSELHLHILKELRTVKITPNMSKLILETMSNFNNRNVHLEIISLYGSMVTYFKPTVKTFVNMAQFENLEVLTNLSKLQSRVGLGNFNNDEFSVVYNEVSKTLSNIMGDTFK